MLCSTCAPESCVPVFLRRPTPMRPYVTALSLAALVSCGIALSAQQPAPATDATKKEPAWDVAAPLGPTKVIDFETDEGTWMNVDVSPDGRTIVFDLLGDIYTMPIGGSGSGLATRLTNGPAFDMQPRFSPDGKRIAFSSDRGGLWNIWVANADGSKPLQVSKENRWFVNSPTWAPDGLSIYARKHFVKQRSLGSGEIWQFHLAGGDGLQVTEKNGWQKDAGEPSVSPDGEVLYYSKDVTPGETFEYNKNPFGVIYAIIRRDLKTGKERTVVARPRRLDHAARLSRRQVAGVHPSRRSRQSALRARPGDRRRRQCLRRPRQGPAGSLGRARRVLAVRVDAGRQGPGRLGQGRTVARRRRREDRHTNSLPREGRADGQRAPPLQPRGCAAEVPRAHASPREGGSRRPQRRVQRPRAPVPACTSGRRTAPPHAGCGARGMAHVLA